MPTEFWDTIAIYGYKIDIKEEPDKNYDDEGLNDYEKSYHDFLVKMQDYQDKYFNKNESDIEVGSNRFSLEIIMTSVENSYEMGDGDISVENQCIVIIGIKNPTGNLKDLAEKHNALLETFASKKDLFKDYELDTTPQFYSGIPWVISEDTESRDDDDSSFNSVDDDSSYDDDDSTYDESDYSDEESETSEDSDESLDEDLSKSSDSD